MTIERSYDFDGATYEKAQFRVIKITTSTQDYEHISTEPNESGDYVVSWTEREESQAVVYVWPDELAYKHRATPIIWFTIKFEYDRTKSADIYGQAYLALIQTLEQMKIESAELVLKE